MKCHIRIINIIFVIKTRDFFFFFSNNFSGRETKTFGGQSQSPGMPIESENIADQPQEQFDRLSVADDRQTVVCRSAGLDQLSGSVPGECSRYYTNKRDSTFRNISFVFQNTENGSFLATFTKSTFSKLAHTML